MSCGSGEEVKNAKMADPTRKSDAGEDRDVVDSSQGSSYLIELNLLMVLCASSISPSSSNGECSSDSDKRIDVKNKGLSGRDGERRSPMPRMSNRGREGVGFQPVEQRRPSFQMRTRDIRHSRKM